jgi:beta-xylosidase
MAARDDTGAMQIILYNGQDPGAGPGDDTYYAVTEAQDIGLTISGLDPEISYDVTTFRVDETPGNAYATWQGLGRPTMSDMSDADWQALRDTMVSPAEPLGDALCGDTFSATFALSSPGVLFVTLEPALASGPHSR